MSFKTTYKMITEAKAPEFKKLELEMIKDYAIDNAGHFHAVKDEPVLKLSFNQGITRKIEIKRNSKSYKLTMGTINKSFANFDKLMKFLENET